MEPIHLDLKLQSGSGYGYILVPSDQLLTDEDVPVTITIGDHQITEHALALNSGQHMIQFRRESMSNLGLETGKTYGMVLERIDQPPQLNDLPPDFLMALKEARSEEDFKRLAPEEQKEIYRNVRMAGSAEAREQAIRSAVDSIVARRKDLPRGDAL
ncbi:MAG TPA: hypothetical protein VHO48_11280 [Anaerolineaceae bacterium]|nr:hypothetical protein [Anaerolineaceae bacterium]